MAASVLLCTDVISAESSSDQKLPQENKGAFEEYSNRERTQQVAPCRLYVKTHAVCQHFTFASAAALSHKLRAMSSR